ncbi:NAD(P)-dependent oxidoreductase [Actinoallomurus iriomotensis]|nr:NAD(P)-dependent oxidoreductase [Actinoallomurus iriomotensis]
MERRPSTGSRALREPARTASERWILRRERWPMAARKVTVIGLGAMGAGIAHRLIESSFAVTVHNRTGAKALPLAEAGATVAPYAAEAVRDADVVLLSLGDEEAVEQVLFGDAVKGLRAGTVVVDTSTVSPAYARDAEERLAALGCPRIEACLIGNPAMARAGELRVLGSGEHRTFEQVGDVLTAIGAREPLYLGATGRAGAMKLAFNLILGAQTAALGEALALTASAGLDRELVLTAITRSGWGSPVLNFRAELMRTRGYEPAGFRARLMAKDLRLAVETAAEAGLTLPVTAEAGRRFGEVVAAGRGDADAAVVCELDRRPAGADAD